MTSRELLDEILSQTPHSERLRLECRLIFRQLADDLHEVRLRNGAQLRDLGDVVEFCKEVVQELTPPVQLMPKPVVSRQVCSRCFHVHEGLIECEVDLGGGGRCDCKVEVSA